MKKLVSFLIRKIPRRYLQLFSHIPLKVVSKLYRGDKYECNVCHTGFKKLLPYGRLEWARENALCPECLTLERHRLMWMFLQKRTNFFEEKLDVLHIAPELPFIKTFEKLHGDKYITGDIESPLAKVKMDVHQIPFEDNKFDCVFCNHVMEHVESDFKAMSEIYRVLKPGGFAIMQAPQDVKREKTYEDASVVTPDDREREFWQSDHVRLFGLDYGNRMEKAGFKVIEDNLVKELPKEDVIKYCLPKDEIIYHAIKPK